MLTFFTTAKAFQGHSDIIQRNALRSWKLLDPDVEVIVFGDDPGAAEVCAELGLRHEPYMKRHESGMKYVDYMFGRAQEIARHDYLCYSNCDIVQLSEFRTAFEKIRKWKKNFLMVARRWDTDVTEPIHFEHKDWADSLKELALTTGFHQIPTFVDFFLFRRGLYTEIPPLLIGRSFWDHWLVCKALDSHVPVIDCSRFVVPVHQNHDYGYHPGGKMGTHRDELAQRNFELCNKGKDQAYLCDSTHAMTKGGMIVRTPLRRALKGLLNLNDKSEFLIHTYRLRRSLGLQRQTLRRITGLFQKKA